MTSAGRRVLRGYSDLTVLRAGRLWTVYRAFDIGSSEWVVMRFIPAGSVQPYLLDELEAQVELLAGVAEHPNVERVRCLLRRSDGSATVVSDLCRESYGDRLSRERQLPLSAVVNAGLGVAAALDAVGEVGLIHRDVKPSRILLSRSGGVVLGGFGLAPLKLSTPGPAAAASVHTAPEVFEGADLSPAADVYSLCSTMYELLSGRPPFRAFDGEAPASLLLRIVGEPAPALRVAGVPLALADLIASGLSKDPGARPATALELARELSAVAGVGVGAAPAAPAAESARIVRDFLSNSTGNRAQNAPEAPVRPPGAPGVASPVSSGRNVLAPITAGRGEPPAARPGRSEEEAGDAGAASATAGDATAAPATAGETTAAPAIAAPATAGDTTGRDRTCESGGLPGPDHPAGDPP